MNAILSRSAFYFCVPLVVPALLLFFIFNVPENYYSGVIFLPALSVIIFFPSFFLADRSFKHDIFYSINLLRQTPEYLNLFARLYAFFILFFCFIDLIVNGVKLLEPGGYADLSATGTHVRHISNMVWTLVPVAYFCVSKPWLRKVLIFCAVVFPILFVDRNRLIQTFYCLVFLSISMKQGKSFSSSKLIFSLVCVLAGFAFLGFIRSGEDAFVVSSSGYYLEENSYPLAGWFEILPVGLQQILLYIVSPLFNFATIFESEYRDSSLLVAQIFPFLLNGSSEANIPVLVPRFNVGTEFFPFLLAGGAWLVVISVVLAAIILFLAKNLFQKNTNIFTLLIFLRVSYCSLMLGFAPQLFTYTNFVFVFLCLFIWYMSNFCYTKLK